MSVDDEVDALYALPPGEFVAARDALAKRAAKQDRTAIKALRKPSVAAHALNRLAREHADEVEELLDAGRALREAQQAALSGGGPDAMRRAGVRRDNAIRGLLAIEPSADVGSLRAASTDEGLAQQLRAGRLTAELTPTDDPFAGFVAPLRAVPDVVESEPEPAADTSLADELAAREAKLREEREAAAKAAQREAERIAAERAARIDAAQAAVDRAEADAHQAQKMHEAAQARLTQARRELDDARRA